MHAFGYLHGKCARVYCANAWHGRLLGRCAGEDSWIMWRFAENDLLLMNVNSWHVVCVGCGECVIGFTIVYVKRLNSVLGQYMWR